MNEQLFVDHVLYSTSYVSHNRILISHSSPELTSSATEDLWLIRRLSATCNTLRYQGLHAFYLI